MESPFSTQRQRLCQSFETKPSDSSSLCLNMLHKKEPGKHKKEPGKRKKEGDKERSFLFLVTIVLKFSDFSKISTQRLRKVI